VEWSGVEWSGVDLALVEDAPLGSGVEERVEHGVPVAAWPGAASGGASVAPVQQLG
jgi:hypothetical protein